MPRVSAYEANLILIKFGVYLFDYGNYAVQGYMSNLAAVVATDPLR